MKELFKKHWKIALPFLILCFLASDAAAIRGPDCFISACRSQSGIYFHSSTNLILAPSVLIEPSFSGPESSFDQESILRLPSFPQVSQSRIRDLITSKEESGVMRLTYLKHKLIVLLSVFWWLLIYFLMYTVFVFQKWLGTLLAIYVILYLTLSALFGGAIFWTGETVHTRHYLLPWLSPSDIHYPQP